MQWLSEIQNSRLLNLFDFLTLEFLSQGAASAVGLPARSFDLVRPGVAPPLVTIKFCFHVA